MEVRWLTSGCDNRDGNRNHAAAGQFAGRGWNLANFMTLGISIRRMVARS